MEPDYWGGGQREDGNKVNPFNVIVIRVGGCHRPHYKEGCRDAL